MDIRTTNKQGCLVSSYAFLLPYNVAQWQNVLMEDFPLPTSPKFGKQAKQHLLNYVLLGWPTYPCCEHCIFHIPCLGSLTTRFLLGAPQISFGWKLHSPSKRVHIKTTIPRNVKMKNMVKVHIKTMIPTITSQF